MSIYIIYMYIIIYIYREREANHNLCTINQAFYCPLAKHDLRPMAFEVITMVDDSRRSCTMLLSPLFFSERTLSSASLKGHFEQSIHFHKIQDQRTPKDHVTSICKCSNLICPRRPLRKGIWGKSSWSSGKDLVPTGHAKIKWAMNCKFYMGLSVCPTEGEAVSDNPPAHPLVRALQGLEPVPCLWLKDTQSSKNMKIQNDTGNDTENDTEIYRGKYKKCISQARRSKQRRTWRRDADTNESRMALEALKKSLLRTATATSATSCLWTQSE
jgi:hypothetical protein